MKFQKSLAAALLATTVLGGAAFAAEKTAVPATAQETAAQKAVDTDIGKLSKDGAQAFRDLHLARIAIFDADPSEAKSLIGKTQAALAKAKTDDALFTKAEDELKTPGQMAAAKSTGAPADKAVADKSKPATTGQVAWLPIDAQLTLGEDFQATPVKALAVSEANKSLAGGDKKAAMEKLRLADIDVSVVLAVLPLDKTIADVDQAATLIGQNKYYEANTLLKTAEDRMRFDTIDVVALPKTPDHASAAKTTSQNAGAALDTKTAK